MDTGPLGLFQQLPTGIIVMFCGSAILLVVAVGFIFRARVVKAQGAAPPPVDHDADDLPDLDLLSNSAPPPMASTAALRSFGSQTLGLMSGETVEVIEVLSVLRDVGEGGLIIRIGDKAYRNPPAMADADFKRRFQATLRDLNGAQQRPAPTPAVEESVPDDDDMPPLDLLPESPRLSPYQPAPGDLPKFKMPDTPIKPKRGQRPVSEPIPEINVAASIEAFLQHKLSMTPMYANRSIHVRPAMHGAVKIEVDGRFYETVGEVEDEGVRVYLAATIEEWQARQ